MSIRKREREQCKYDRLLGTVTAEAEYRYSVYVYAFVRRTARRTTSDDVIHS